MRLPHGRVTVAHGPAPREVIAGADLRRRLAGRKPAQSGN